MQTASTVEAGRWRAGGQLSAAAFCGSLAAGAAGVLGCTEYPDGIPLPEARLDARHGVAAGTDVGLSLQVAGQLQAVERPLQLGLTADAKREVLRVPAGQGLAHVVSVGGLLGGGVAGRVGLAPWLQVEGGVPVFYGLQGEHLELVAGLSYSARLLVPQVGAPVSTPVVSQRVGAVLGLYGRAPAGWAVQGGYLVNPARPGAGALQLQLGWFFDL
jgi:hypothetical protein